jgi:hypothetical protein
MHGIKYLVMSVPGSLPCLPATIYGLQATGLPYLVREDTIIPLSM